jgi:uncharacterized membrane protein YwzB
MELLILRVLITLIAGFMVLCLFVFALQQYNLQQIEAMSKRKGLAIMAMVCFVFFVTTAEVFCHSKWVLDFLTNK